MQLETKKKETKKRERQEKSHLVDTDADAIQLEPRSLELPLNSTLNINKYANIRKLDEEKRKVINNFFKNNDLRLEKLFYLLHNIYN